MKYASLFLLFFVLTVCSQAQQGPIRVLYMDAPNAAVNPTGPLHEAMRDLGRDAIWFDHAKDFHANYDVVLNSNDAGAKPEEIRAKVLASIKPERKAAWEAFLAQREPEKREPHPMVANYEKRPQPLTFQHPFSVKGSMERTQVPADCELKLFA